jgi:hypothetical protein
MQSKVAVERLSSGGPGDQHSTRAGQSQLRKALSRAHLQRVVMSEPKGIGRDAKISLVLWWPS